MGKATPIVGGTLREECDGPGGRADLIVLLEAHDLPDVTEITVERIDSEAAAGRIAAGIAGETRASLAQRDAQTGQLAGRGWISARRAPGVATRLLREATRWKPCYAIRHPASCTEEAISEAIARLLSEDAVSGKSAAGPQSKPRPEATAKPRAQTRRANNNPASSEKAQRHTRG
jgi:hypothetical protein